MNAAPFAVMPRPVDLLDAIRQLYIASPAFAIGGPMYLKASSRRRAVPYVCVEVVSAPLSFTSSTSKIRKTRLRFRVYADDADDALAPADAIEDAFSGQTLLFQGGFTGPLVIGDRGPRKDAGLSNAGSEIWYELIEFTLLVKRS